MDKPVKIISEDQPCRNCGFPVRRKARDGHPTKRNKGGYYFEWWLKYTNRRCRTVYLIEGAKRWQDPPIERKAQSDPLGLEGDAFDRTSALAFLSCSRAPKPEKQLSPKRIRRLEVRRKRKLERRRRGNKVKLPWAYEQYEAYIDSAEWRAFRLALFAVRGKRCEKCGLDDNGVRHVHHLHYRTLGHEGELDVLILCRDCHKKAHPEKPQTILSFGAFSSCNLSRPDIYIGP